MRILITGSSGLLGATIARQLSASHEVVGIERVYAIEKAECYLGYRPAYNFWQYIQELSTSISSNS